MRNPASIVFRAIGLIVSLTVVSTPALAQRMRSQPGTEDELSRPSRMTAPEQSRMAPVERGTRNAPPSAPTEVAPPRPSESPRPAPDMAPSRSPRTVFGSDGTVSRDRPRPSRQEPSDSAPSRGGITGPSPAGEDASSPSRVQPVEGSGPSRSSRGILGSTSVERREEEAATSRPSLDRGVLRNGRGTGDEPSRPEEISRDRGGRSKSEGDSGPAVYKSRERAREMEPSRYRPTSRGEMGVGSSRGRDSIGRSSQSARHSERAASRDLRRRYPSAAYRTVNHRHYDRHYRDYVDDSWWDLGPVSFNWTFYAPHVGSGSSFFVQYRYGRPGGVYYRSYRCSPFRYAHYYTFPWYSTYYYSSSWYWPYAVSYAPGFAAGFSYDSDDDAAIYFSYGYGGGIRFGECPWVYSWYPFGGYERLVVTEAVPDAYCHYVAPYVTYEVD